MNLLNFLMILVRTVPFWGVPISLSLIWSAQYVRKKGHDKAFRIYLTWGILILALCIVYMSSSAFRNSCVIWLYEFWRRTYD